MKPAIEYRPKRPSLPLARIKAEGTTTPAKPRLTEKAISAAFKAIDTPQPTHQIIEKPKRNRSKPFATIVQAFKEKMTVVEAMDVVKKLARPELEAIAIAYVIDRAKRQKQKKVWQKRWRDKQK